jgi:hypothetical protein
MFASIAIGVGVAIALLVPYFAYHRFIRGNASPLREPPARNRPPYRELEDIIASKPSEISALHGRLVHFREVLMVAAIASICILFVAAARKDIPAAILAWTLAGLSGSLHLALRAHDAVVTEVTFASRWLISPIADLAEGKAARRYGIWLFVRSVATLVFTLLVATILIVFTA